MLKTTPDLITMMSQFIATPSISSAREDLDTSNGLGRAKRAESPAKESD